MNFYKHYYESESDINKVEVMSLDQFFTKEKKKGDLIDIKIEEDIKDADVKDVDIADIKAARLKGTTKGVDIAKRPEKLIHKSNIIDETGKIIDDEALMQMIMVRPKRLIGGSNTKMQDTTKAIASRSGKMKDTGKYSGQVFYDTKLPSYQGLYVDEKNKKFQVVKTCPLAGECTKYCYAAKGGFIQFPKSSLGMSRIINYLMNDNEGFKKQMIREINEEIAKKNKQGKQVVIRWHSSGDFFSEKYIQLAYDIANKTPNALHYAYTKNVPLVKKMEKYRPDNFILNFSFGGKKDELIDVTKDKYAKVIPAKYFADLKIPGKKGPKAFTPEGIKKIKERISKDMNIPIDTIITNDELVVKPESDKPKWNVLVWKGHGDESPARKDTLGTLMFIH